MTDHRTAAITFLGADNDTAAIHAQLATIDALHAIADHLATLADIGHQLLDRLPETDLEELPDPDPITPEQLAGAPYGTAVLNRDRDHRWVKGIDGRWHTHGQLPLPWAVLHRDQGPLTLAPGR